MQPPRKRVNLILLALTAIAIVSGIVVLIIQKQARWRWKGQCYGLNCARSCERYPNVQEGKKIKI